MHGLFMGHLRRLQPDPRTMKLFRAIIADVWAQRVSDRAAEAKMLMRRIKELEGKKERLVWDSVDRRIADESTYQRMIRKIDEEIDMARAELDQSVSDDIDVESVLNFAEVVLSNLAQVWNRAGHLQKRRLQRILFPEGVHFTEGAFGTDPTSVVFNVLDASNGEEKQVVSPTGFEPVSPP